MKDLDSVYQKRMEEINQGIEEQVRSEYQPELDQVRSDNGKATFWNDMGNRFVNHRQAEINHENTQKANQNREADVEDRIQSEIDNRSEDQARIAGAEIFEDFGGSREAAFQQLEEFEAEQKAQIKSKAELEFDVASGMQAQKQEQIKSKAYWNFDLASGTQQQKRDAIKDQTKDAFRKMSQAEKFKQEQTEEKQEEVENEVTVEIKTPEKEQATKTLAPAYWKQAQKTEAQFDTSNLITSPAEQSYDARMAARITKSFSRSKSIDRSL